MEIQAGEGGSDAKLFTHDLAGSYVKWAVSHGLSVEIVDSSEGYAALSVAGGWDLFSVEAGKHCVQRVPPTERGGRRHTSIVVVMVTRAADGDADPLKESDVSFDYMIGTGPGGQHRQKTASAVRAKHKPTGLTVVIDGRHQHQNKRLAMRLLAAKVLAREDEIRKRHARDKKSSQWGGGGRSDKIRTYNFIESRAVDHRTGNKTARVRDVIEKGRFDLLA